MPDVSPSSQTNLKDKTHLRITARAPGLAGSIVTRTPSIESKNKRESVNVVIALSKMFGARNVLVSVLVAFTFTISTTGGRQIRKSELQAKQLEAAQRWQLTPVRRASKNITFSNPRASGTFICARSPLSNISIQSFSWMGKVFRRSILMLVLVGRVSCLSVEIKTKHAK